MKRMLAVFSSVVLIFTSASIMYGQKSEQKIKIKVNDGSGTKVLIDTLLTNPDGPDSLLLKDGSVVYLKNPGEDDKRLYVISDQGPGVTKEITIISTDSMHNDSHGNVYYYNNSGPGNHHSYRVVKHRSGADNSNATSEETSDDTFTIATDENPDSRMDKSRYVIAKDGVVVTIESSDDAKAKDLAKEIEKKLGVTDKNNVKEAAVSKTGKKNNK